MRHLKTFYHPSFDDYKHPLIQDRNTARAIILKGNEILLIYTERYNDYTFPGGGVEPGEDMRETLIREINEETGAKNVQIIKPFGIYEEFRPNWKEEYDLSHITSYYYVCDSDYELGESQMESYEIANGSRPVWVDLDQAIAYNHEVMSNKEKNMGLSIQRETYMLEKIKEELLSLQLT